MLELRWHVASDVTSSLQGQVLCAVQNSKRVAHDFLLATEVTSVALVVTCKVVARAAVADENWIIGSHGLTLTLETEVGVRGINDPDAGVGRLAMHSGFVEA